jgi:hypothetical protein
MMIEDEVSPTRAQDRGPWKCEAGGTTWCVLIFGAILSFRVLVLERYVLFATHLARSDLKGLLNTGRAIASHFGNRLYKPCYNKSIFKALLRRCALQVALKFRCDCPVNTGSWDVSMEELKGGITFSRVDL